MKIQYTPQDVCCMQMNLVISDDNKVEFAEFYGGCNGNLQGISKLIVGMDVDEVITKLSGISCSGRPTSCPDQLARCLMEYKRHIESQS